MILEISQEFATAMDELDQSEHVLALKPLRRLEAAFQPFGKRLTGDLGGCFPVRAGHNSRLRIVYEPVNQVARVIIIGARAKGLVYKKAAAILNRVKG